ncbi:MAG: DUF4434 domain-containing protein [Phycisphaerae bacterium]|nr:DUF4434 domain-containing protein [Phycisphaerae bacterium]
MAEAYITGSFYTIQMTNIWNTQYWHDECRNWQEANWRAFVTDQHEIGIDTLINKQMSLWTRPLFPDPEHKSGMPLKLGCDDPAGVVADEADKLGMKVWYGLGMYGRDSEVGDYQGLSKPWPEIWFQWNQALCERIMERYSHTKSFAGLYLPLELSGDPAYGDTRLNEDHVELYRRWIHESIRPIAGKVPLLTSPGILHPGNYDILAGQLETLGVDIVAYQDYGGRGLNTPEDYARIDRAAKAFELLAPVHEKVGVKLWANCETFCRGEQSVWREVCFPGEIDRIIHQLKVCSPPVEKVITWIYQGVMNKRTELVNIGPDTANELYYQYVEYLDNTYPNVRK